MAQQACALFLNHHNLRNSRDPDQYAHVLRADDLELAALADSDELLRVLDVRDASQKAECEHIVHAHASDPQCTAIIAVFRDLTGHVGGTKRRRVSSGPGVYFPTHDQAGKKKINQGPGGDLSFLPAAHPLICKQSCKYIALCQEGDWSSKREVRPVLMCMYWWVKLSELHACSLDIYEICLWYCLSLLDPHLVYHL